MTNENGSGSTDLATMDARQLDAFAAYGAKDTAGAQFGRFTKDGVWEFGINGDVPGEYDLFAVDMGAAERGWICWVGGSVADEVMYPIASGKSVSRNELTDYGPYGSGDGWNEQAKFLIKNLESGDQIEIKGSSTGFRNMSSRLCASFAERMRSVGGVDRVPIVSLDAGHYIHKKYGRINIPLMHVVGWSSEASLAEGLTAKARKEMTTAAKAAVEDRRASNRRR